MGRYHVIPYTKLVPWIGYPLAIGLFWLWLEGRDTLAAQVESCNTDKIRAVADAEKTVREALQGAQERERTAATERLRRATEAAERAVAARLEAEQRAERARATIRRLMQEMDTDEPIEIEQACLAVELPADLVDSLR